MWPIGIAMSSFYIYVYIESTFYAFACINIYYIIAGFYGWYKWHVASKKQDVNEPQIELQRTPTRLWSWLILASIIIFVIIFYASKTFTDSHVIWGDSIITTLSIVAMWMLAHRYVEQWILLIIVNILSIFIYFDQQLYPTSFMYLGYSIVSVFGYIRWKNLVKK